jgi:arylsulfatase A-like enzyme
VSLSFPLFLLAAVPAPAAQESAAPEPQAMNVVLLLADDLGWGDLSYQGGSLPTPCIDALAAEGVAFSAAYAAAPNCSPSRASLITGRYTPRHGIFTVPRERRDDLEHQKLESLESRWPFAEEELTLAEILRAAGYATAIIGKWQLSEDPRLHGFDFNRAANENGYPPSYFSPYKNRDLENGPRGEYLTDRLTDEAITFIESKREQPFFLYLPYYTPHQPYQAPAAMVKARQVGEGFEARRKATYEAMVQSLDNSVGRILGALEANGLAERTLVLFSSDNGARDVVALSRPWRGEKGEIYEGAIRVPLIARWPGRIPGGRVETTPVHQVDLLPTILEFAAIERPEPPLDGLSLAGLLEREEPLPGRDLYWYFPVYMGGRRPGEWRTTPVNALRSGKYKLVEYFEGMRVELYDLEADPHESHDLAAEQDERARELQTRLESWRREIGAVVPRKREASHGLQDSEPAIEAPQDDH